MPLINRCGGSGGTPQLCGQVDNFVVHLGNLSAILSWSAPEPNEDNSFVGVRIVRKTGSVPSDINDGTVVYEGTALSYTDTGLLAGTTYYYRAFAYNAKKKYQTEYRVASRTAIALKPNFADNTWEQIIAACQSGSVPDTWVVGDNKTMTIDGVNYQFDIVGKNHDTYTAGGIAPLTFGLHDCYADTKQMNSSKTNSGGWTSCAMRSTHLPAILALMPTEVQNGIREVNKLTTEGDQIATINTTADKLFTFSETEVYGKTTYSYSGEGKQYDYYKAGNSKIKKVGTAADRWWLRSPIAFGNNSFCAVNEGGAANSSYANNPYGVCFGFCF